MIISNSQCNSNPTLGVDDGNKYLYTAWNGGNDNLIASKVNLSASGDIQNGPLASSFNGEKTSTGPSLVLHNGLLFIAWKGSGNSNLNVAQVFNQKTKVILSDTSSHGPAIASWNGLLFIAWKGSGNDNLNIMYSSNNGVTFQGKCVSGEKSSCQPTLTVHNNQLYIAYKGSGNDSLNVAQVNIQCQIINKQIFGDTSSAGPSLVSHNGLLLMAWKGSGNSNLNAAQVTGFNTSIVTPPALPSGWHGWEPLTSVTGALSTSNPAAVSWGLYRIDVITRQYGAAASDYFHFYWDTLGWHKGELLGGALLNGPAVCSWGEGRLDVFGIGTDGQMYHKWYQNGWQPWESLGGQFSPNALGNAAAVSWGPGRIDLFAIGANHDLVHMWFGGGAWHSWESLGGTFLKGLGPAVSSWSTGRLDIFVVGTDNKIYHKWFYNTWGGFENLGGYAIGSPCAVSKEPNQIDFFYKGSSSNLVHRYWNGANWSSEENLGGPFPYTGMGVSSRSAGLLDFFGSGTDSELWHMYWQG
jgi:hypothetical protein